jgi:hypothetical protein
MASQWVAYSNPTVGVTVSHPKDWTVQTLSDTQFVISGPAERDGYRPQLSYVRMTPDGTGDEWLAETIRYSEEQQRAAYPDYRVLRSEEVTVAGVRAFWRQVEWRYDSTAIYSVNLQVMIWPNAATAFVLKAATLKTLAARDVPLLERMILSTQLT